MKWTRGYRSDDVEDRRGQSGPGGRGLPTGVLALIGSRFGIAGVVLAVLAYGAFQLLSSSPLQPAMSRTPATDERVQFASFVLDDVQNTWAQKMTGYERAKLVVFSGSTETACGYGDRAVGPFYCPRDGRVYLDVDFFQTLSKQLGARGDFAQAYVIAHEIGHHVQFLMGPVRPPTPGEHGTSVKLELQADCYAGVWAHGTQQRQLLESGDLDEALEAAAAIGDDRLQQLGHGTVKPETWTHGSSAQRRAWFERGLQSGDPQQCDTFEMAGAGGTDDATGGGMMNSILVVTALAAVFPKAADITTNLDRLHSDQREIGLIAVAQGSTPAIRDFGEDLASEHQVIDDQLRDYAKKHGINLPPRPLGQVALTKGRTGLLDRTALGYSGGDSPSLMNVIAESAQAEPVKDPPNPEFARLRLLRGTKFDEQFLATVIENSARGVDHLEKYRAQKDIQKDKELVRFLDRSIKQLQKDKTRAEAIVHPVPVT